MRYEISLPFRGDVAAAFDTAVIALTALGFRLTAKDNGSLDFTGPGMTNTRESALLGASQIRVVAGADTLSLEAELGGVARMARFLAFFPAGLCLFLFLLTIAIAAAVFPQQLGLI